MAAVVLLTGRWSGHYRQHGAEHPLNARLRQEGLRLSGTMTDGEPRTERSVFEVALDAGLAPGQDEEIVARLREQYPDVPSNAPIRFVTILPAESLLEGSVQGRQIAFLKTYQGEHFSGFRIGEQRVGQTVDNHAVHYQGEVDAAGMVIRGHWWIEPSLLGERRAEGTFELRRFQEKSKARGG